MVFEGSVQAGREQRWFLLVAATFSTTALMNPKTKYMQINEASVFDPSRRSSGLNKYKHLLSGWQVFIQLNWLLSTNEHSQELS